MRKYLISLVIFSSLVAASPAASMQSLIKEELSQKTQVCEMITASKFNEKRMLGAIDRVKKFAKDFRENFVGYFRNYCHRLKERYDISCTFELF